MTNEHTLKYNHMKPLTTYFQRQERVAIVRQDTSRMPFIIHRDILLAGFRVRLSMLCFVWKGSFSDSSWWSCLWFVMYKNEVIEYLYAKSEADHAIKKHLSEVTI